MGHTFPQQVICLVGRISLIYVFHVFAALGVIIVDVFAGACNLNYDFVRKAVVLTLFQCRLGVTSCHVARKIGIWITTNAIAKRGGHSSGDCARFEAVKLEIALRHPASKVRGIVERRPSFGLDVQKAAHYRCHSVGSWHNRIHCCDL